MRNRLLVDTQRSCRARLVTGLVLFGVSFGYVEAALVTYLRALYDPVRARLYPAAAAGELFPMIRLEQLEAEGPEHVRRLGTELAREASTMVMLAAVALTATRNLRDWFAAFLVAFGVWDVSYYAFLRVLIGWPASLFTWDLLFLIPVPWSAPVLAPVLVALSMIVAGGIALGRESGGGRLPLTAAHAAAIVAGGALLVLAFCWSSRTVLAGGVPERFPWLLFAAGEATGMAGFAHALGRHRSSSGRRFSLQQAAD
jgi:hypothetical protein